MRKLMILMLLMLVGLPLMSQRVRTTRRQLHRSVAETADTLQALQRPDIIVPPDSGVVLSGFDKPVSSMYETMFATNRLDRRIDCVYLSLEYFDSAGRQLHSRRCCVRAVIPAGETRQLSFRTWDRQGSFYYHRSRRPRVSAAPFSVKCRVDSVLLTRD